MYLHVSVNRIMAGKTLNAGQICLAPDYVFVPEAKKDNFISQSKDTFTGFLASVDSISHIEAWPKLQ